MTRLDPLTAAERAEVQRRIDAKAITVLPAGRTCFEYPKWDGKKLVTPEGENGFRASMGRFHGKGGAKMGRRRKAVTPPLAPHIPARRQEVAKLHEQGAALAEMLAAIPGATASTVRHDLHVLGLTPHPRVHPQKVDHADRERRIRDMAAQGHSVLAIAAALPLAADTVRRLAKSYGLSFPRKKRREAKCQSIGEVAKAVVAKAQAARDRKGKKA